MNTILLKYQNFMKNKNKAENTITTYLARLVQFFDWIKSYYGLTEIDIEALKTVRWQDIEDVFLPMGNPKPSTYNNRHSAINGLYDFLIRRGELVENPTVRIDKLKISKSEPVYLTKEEVNEILFQARNYEKENAKRNECMLYVFLESGLRLSELVALHKKDFVGNRVRVQHGKGDKERFVFISDETRTRVETYWASRKDTSEYAFITGRGTPRPLNEKSIQPMLNIYLELAKIEKKITPHKLRHTFATIYYSKTKDLRKLQELLGHSSSKTTDIYAHVANTQSDETIEKGMYD